MLTDAELTALRADIEADMLPGTVVIQRATRGTNTNGYAGSVTYSAVGTVAARVDPMPNNARREGAGDKEATVFYRQLTIPYGTDITAGDRVVYAGRSYEIRAIADDHSLRAVRRVEIVVTE